MKITEIYNRFQECNGVSIDTRTIKDGQLFVALKGASFDGNLYAASALGKGAKYALVDNPEIVKDDRYLLVSSTLTTLQELAKYHRRKLDVRVIGLTGSNGKTTTKELLACVLSTRYKVSATKGNYNNHIGVPLTLLNTPVRTELLIVEMGSNQPGDIGELCEMVMPDYGLITNIGASHLEKLGSLEGVLKEKRSLYDIVIQRGGVFFLNIGDPMLKRLAKLSDHAKNYSQAGGTYGTLTLLREINKRHISLIFKSEHLERTIHTNLSGIYNQENVSAVLEVSDFFNIPVDDALRAIARYHPENMRSQVIDSVRNVLVLDAYNANPTSMVASISSLQEEAEDSGIQFILGDMLELGAFATEYHQEIVDFLISKGAGQVILVGPLFSALPQEEYPVFADAKSLIDSGHLSTISGKVILIKASRGIKLESIVPYL